MSHAPAARKLTDFAGQWRLERQIVHEDGTVAQFTGTATWTPDGDRLRCVEQGALRIADAPAAQSSSRRVFESSSPGSHP